jgi:hypothetical protein
MSSLIEKERLEGGGPAYSQTGCSGLAPAPELFPYGARAAATSPSGRLWISLLKRALLAETLIV